jgi:23S rRNA pseudouridine955/2504/2580 synthase
VVKHFGNATLLDARLVTGRTHQIRVHAASSGHPLIGDDKYGSRKFDKAVFHAPANRLFLHAMSVSFPQYLTTKTITVSAKTDTHWEDALNNL